MGSDSGISIIEQLAADHRRIQSLLDRVRSAPPGSDERTSLVEQAGSRLVSHLVAEKERLYPLVDRYVVDGDEGVDGLLAVDERIQRALKSLEDVPADSERYAHLLLCLVSGVTEHVVGLEQRLFPRLQAMSPVAVLRDAGAGARRAEAVGPTRPRPDAPGSPALTKLTSAVWGPWDRLRARLARRGLQ
ncbi:hemerythrin domain-containing protein [Streptomyces sp. NPDC000987]|uniref:hemerythrin domain-containing protein n=1 Tax=Streptomyces sp. NPDC000987 TaxID=3154374 RepID=UPI00332D491C